MLLVAESYPATEIRAVSVGIVPTAPVTFTVKVTVAVSLTARLPRLHTTAPVPPTGAVLPAVDALGGNTRVDNKILSMFEPDTEVIRKGKASKAMINNTLYKT